MKRIKIGHDNKGVAAGWFLEKVRLLLAYSDHNKLAAASHGSIYIL